MIKKIKEKVKAMWKWYVSWLFNWRKMNKKPLNISEEAAVQMPMKTVASLIALVAIGTMGIFSNYTKH